MSDPMRFAYADPPYYGYAAKFYADKHPNAADYDSLDAHAALIDRLSSEFPDGWALSMTSGNLKDILPLCPRDCRVLAWVKPFCSFKLGVGIAYAWEPIVLRGGRKRAKEQSTVRDWCAANITLQRGLVGAKPREMLLWLFEVLNMRHGDELVDLFPGTGVTSSALEEFLGLGGRDAPLFMGGAA